MCGCRAADTRAVLRACSACPRVSGGGTLDRARTDLAGVGGDPAGGTMEVVSTIFRTFDQATASVCTPAKERPHVHVAFGGPCGPRDVAQSCRGEVEVRLAIGMNRQHEFVDVSRTIRSSGLSVRSLRQWMSGKA